MANYALLIGTTGEKRELLLSGNPREVRDFFKTSSGEGFDMLEVIEKNVGRTRYRAFSKPEKPVAKKAAKETL